VNSTQLDALLDWMERIDRGEAPARIGGPIGSFLRRYSDERNDVVRLALEHSLGIRADGAVSGRDLQGITLAPLLPSETAKVFDSHWGPVARYLAVCPELMTCITLRLWLATASGRDAYRLLTSSPSSALEVRGDFRWLPPGTLTPGTAEFELKDPFTREPWAQVAYLKATADDINDIPHALDYRDFTLGDRVRLACLRTFAALHEGDTLVVPGGVRSHHETIDFPEEVIPQEPAGSLFLCLGFREPGTRWQVWRMRECSEEEIFVHNFRWASFRRYLAATDQADEAIASAVTGALTAVGLGVAPKVPAQEPLGPSLGELGEFVRGVASKMRLG
jgi:hypothetical protein